MSKSAPSFVRKAAPFFVLLVIAGIGFGTWAVYARTKEMQRAARENAFADLSVCLLGERVASGDDTIDGISATQARIAHATTPDRAPVQGAPWPQRCSTQARDMMEAVRQSSLLDETARTDLLKVLDELAKELDAVRAQDTYLARAVLAVWRSAEKAGMSIGESSSAEGPPTPRPLEGSPDLPFSGLYSVPGGPQWAFLTDRKERPNALSLCRLSPDAMLCEEFESSGKITTACTWDSPALVPIVEDQIVKVFRNGRLAPVDVGFIDGGQCHVDADGTFYALTRAGDERDVVWKTLDGKVERMPLAKVVKTQAEPVGRFLLGSMLVLDVGERLLAIDLGPEGPAKAAPVVLGPSPAGAYDFVRAGRSWILVGRAPPTLTPVDFVKGFGTPVSPSAPVVGGGNPSGWMFTQKSVCSSTGCRNWIEEEESASFIAGVGRVPGRDMSGSNLVTAWAAKGGHGVLLSVENLADEQAKADLVLVSPRSDVKDNPIAVFGDDFGAIVLAEVEKRVVGARVFANGSTGPLLVDWK